ncbi:MAG TPA: hypothetical protein VEC99_15475 [Clostridia bacterium]|nr:hypothetical protein [Clostridia bacterium]
MSANRRSRWSRTSSRSLSGPSQPRVAAESFRTCPEARLIVEAQDQTTAHNLFIALLTNPESTPEHMTELTSGLFFARTQETGRYWTFWHRTPLRAETGASLQA